MTVAARATPATVKMMRRARAAVFMLAIWSVRMRSCVGMGMKTG